jgi:TolB-like protein
MRGKVIEISLFGACTVKSVGGHPFEITGGKHRALFALLATAPFGRRSRSFLQETLWGVSCYDTGRQSLRRALSDIKQIMGPAFEQCLAATNSDLTLDLSTVGFIGQPGVGEFLEGLDVREPAYLRWLQAVRADAGQLDGLFRQNRTLLLPTTLPVIAVLPFRSIGGGEDDAVLGDWLAEEMCRALSRSKLIAVISHLSSRAFARGGFDLGGVDRTLRATYCLAGSLRRQGGEIVLDVDLVDVPSSRILLTRQFRSDERSFVNDSGDGIAAVIRATGAAIADDTLNHVRGRDPIDIPDHRLLVAGVNLMHSTTLRDFARSRQLLEEAARRSPLTPEVHAWLGKWYILSVFNGWSGDTGRETQMAIDQSARALDLSPDNGFCLTINGFAHANLLKRLDIAEARYDAALASNPNESLGWLLKGALHTFRNEGHEAIASSQTARRLSPIDPFDYYYDAHMAGACLAIGDYERALDLADRSFRKNDRHLSTLRIKLFAAHYLAQGDKRDSIAKELMRRQPNFNVGQYMKIHPSAGSDMGRLMEKALLAAHIPSGA